MRDNAEGAVLVPGGVAYLYVITIMYGMYVRVLFDNLPELCQQKVGLGD